MIVCARTRRGALPLPAAVLLAGFLAASPSLACTSFCLDTPDGPVYATNLDLFFPVDGIVLVNRRGVRKENVRPDPDGTTTAWVSRYASVTFNIAGRGFPWSGMNEAGLVASPMQLMAGEYPEPDERPPFDTSSWVQYVLDTCGDVADVIALAPRIRLVDDAEKDAPNHLMLADAKGECVALEYLDGELVCRTGDELPVKAMTNMRYERALAAYERGGPHWWWSNPGASAERFAAAADRMKTYDPSRDGPATSYAMATLTRFVAAPHTKWSIVYDIPHREVHYRTAQSPFLKHLALRDFDLACDAPLRMLPVHAPLSGNVAPDFVPYDAAVNRNVLRAACEEFGIELTGETADALTELFDGFDCAPPAD